uniref:Uncharacterized protein n=1 Tax=Meloidogyne floridensis TaxID=298350 RepID=A0A915P3U5_9BILA
MFYINTLSTTSISCKATNGIIPSIIPLRKSKSEREIYQGENELKNSGSEVSNTSLSTPEQPKFKKSRIDSISKEELGKTIQRIDNLSVESNIEPITCGYLCNSETKFNNFVNLVNYLLEDEVQINNLEKKLKNLVENVKNFRSNNFNENEQSSKILKEISLISQFSTYNGVEVKVANEAFDNILKEMLKNG